MSSRLTVVYDACVLYPAPLRDLLMHLALTDLYRACWSDLIHDEWTRNVLANRPGLTLAQLNRTRQLMNAHVRDSLVFGFESLIPSIDLPDPDDFIGDLLDQHPAGVLGAVARHRRSLKHPPRTVEEYLGTLQAQGLTQSVAMLQRWSAAI